MTKEWRKLGVCDKIVPAPESHLISLVGCSFGIHPIVDCVFMVPNGSVISSWERKLLFCGGAAGRALGPIQTATILLEREMFRAIEARMSTSENDFRP